MSTQLIPFSFESHEIRVLIVDNTPWWVAADVCAALDIGNNRMALERLDDDEKGVSSIDTLGGKQDVLTVNEPGLYSLILGSRKPEAKSFKRWVTHEVLPAIRQTGSYSIPTSKHAAPKLTREERYRLGVYRDAVKTAQLVGFIGNMALLSADNYCKATLGCSVLAPLGATHLLADECGKVYTPTELGQLMNPPLSAVKFNLALEMAGLQKKELGGWLPTDSAEDFFEWADTGKKHSNGTPVKQLRWFKTVMDRLMSGGMKEAA